MWDWNNIKKHRHTLKAYKAAYKIKLTQGKAREDTEKQIQVWTRWIVDPDNINAFKYIGLSGFAQLCSTKKQNAKKIWVPVHVSAIQFVKGIVHPKMKFPLINDLFQTHSFQDLHSSSKIYIDIFDEIRELSDPP